MKPADFQGFSLRSALQVVLTIGLGLCCGNMNLQAAEPVALDKLKAAYLLKIPNYVQWDPGYFSSKKDSFRFCFLGNSPLYTLAAKEFSKRTTRGRKIQVKEIYQSHQMKECEVVHFGDLNPKALESYFNNGMGESILTTGESQNFLHHGGILRFYQIEGKLRFEINLKAARKANLEFSARLLRLWKIFNERLSPKNDE